MPRVGSAPAADASAQQEFLERYEQLLVWALRLTGSRDVEAHDLVHDAFVAYASGHRDHDVRNLNGYLYGILRNLLRADRRRAERRSWAPWEAAEATPGVLRDPAIDAATRLEARETLLHIARFARERSHHSKSGSAVLLRYFHGYAPREIARIMRVPASNVDDWLKLGRREARSAAASMPPPPHDPPSPSASPVVRPFRRVGSGAASPGEEALVELRSELFQASPGRCLSRWRVNRLYGSQPAVPIDTTTLAHIVTCADCLDRVSDRLGFPGITERHPIDGLMPSTRAGSATTRQAAVAGALVLAVMLALGPGRAHVEAAASALMQATRAAIGSIVDSVTRIGQRGQSPLPSTPVSLIAPLMRAPGEPIRLARALAAPSTGTAMTEAAALGVEVEALQLLDRHGLLLGRQFDLSRGRDGRVRFSTFAAGADERTRLLSALAPLAKTSAFVPDIRTPRSAARAGTETHAPATMVRDLELTQEPSPLLAAARQQLTEVEVSRFVNRVLDGSRQALLHASLMQDLVRRFDAPRLGEINPTAHATWDTMLRYHALAVARETERVRAELSVLTPGAASADPALEEFSSSSDGILRLVTELRDLAVSHDDTLGAELAARPLSDARPQSDTDGLLRSLHTAERLAQRIAER